jgi:anti-sigma regulatory factor (Ser/Thr protein kinase)
LIEIAITPNDRELLIEVKDTGRPFDIDEVAPLPTELDEASLPEGGMGIHIAKTMLDEMTYEPGPPNLWRLCKRLPAARAASSGRS